MNARIAKAYEKIAEGYAELALAYGDIEQPGAGRAAVSPRPAPAPAGMAPSFDDLPPMEEDAPQGIVAQVAQMTGGTPVADPNSPLSRCPEHGEKWVVKPGGVSKAGKPYNAFWKCNQKNADGSYCNQKPKPAWLAGHPPLEGAAA